MSQTATRASVNTTLKIGTLDAPIALYKIVGNPPKKQKWEVVRPGEDSAPDAPTGSPLGSSTPSASSGGVPSSSSGGAKPDQAAEPEKPRKGIRKDDGAFVDLTDQIEEISERAKLEQMEVVSFIDRSHVPRERITASYFVAGTYEATAYKVLNLLAAGMRESGRVAVVRFSKRKGQTLGVITAGRRDGALVLLELAFAEQVREPGPKCLAHTHAEFSDAEKDAAIELVTALGGKRESLDDIGDLRAQMESELASRALEGELDDYTLPDADPAADPAIGELGDILREAAKAAA